MSASSNRPSRRSAAPVKAPFSWPNSSLSSSVSGRAAQLTVTNGRRCRGREVVDRPGHQLLAGAALALDQDGAAHRGHLLDLDQHFLDRGAFADDPGALLEAPALEQAAGGLQHLVRPGRLHHRLGDAEADDALGALGVGGLEQGEGADLVVAGHGGEGDRVGLVDGAGEDDEVGVGAADGGPGVVHAAQHGGGVARPFHGGVEGDGGLEIVHGDEDAGCHGAKITGGPGG